MSEEDNIGQTPEELYDSSSRRHGFVVWNAKEKDPELVEFEREEEGGSILYEELNEGDYEVSSDLLRGFAVFPTHRICHLVGGKPGKYDGMYLGEEYTGLPHPLILLPKDLVIQKKR